MLSLVAELKSLVYSFITATHIVYYLLPIIGPVIGWVCFGAWRQEDEIEDDGGATMRVTKWNGRTFPAFGKHRFSAIKDVPIRKDDVILCGYPKTGCHWTFEILRMLLAKETKLSKYGKGFEGMIDAVPHLLLDSLPSPRVMNSHMLYEDLPKGIFENKNKIVLTIRNPKDTVVSFYHHTLNIKQFYKYEGTFENYFKMFINGQVDYGDYFDFYASWNHVIKESQKDNDIFLLEFEELKKNPVNKITELASFLGIAISREFAEEIAEASSFNKMKQARKKTSKVFRKGVVGDWKNVLTEEQCNAIDDAQRRKLSDFKLPSQKASMT